MNKKILVYMLMMLPALLMTSCLKDQSDTFDKSASIRSAEYLEKTKRVLESSENGWVFNYYPDRYLQYGGFSYVLVFNNQNVTAYFVNGEVVEDPNAPYGEAPVPKMSSYSLTNEDGPVIAFDTYNDYLHYYATPSGASGAGGYEAYDGDFIFIVLDISEDENTITLKGNRTGNIMYLYRNTIAPEEYMAQCINVKNNLLYEIYKDESTYMELDLETQQGIVTVGDEAYEMPFIITNEGLKFYEPFTIQGKNFDSFTYDFDSRSFIPDQDESTTLVGSLPVGWRSYEELLGTYKVGTSDDAPTVTVTANGDGETYTIKGIEPYVTNSQMTAKYKYTKGSFVISPQKIGRYSSYYAWILAVSDESISWDQTIQFKGSNSADLPLTITFKHGTYTTLMTYAFNDDPPTADGMAGVFTEFEAPFKLIKVE